MFFSEKKFAKRKENRKFLRKTFRLLSQECINCYQHYYKFFPSVNKISLRADQAIV